MEEVTFEEQPALLEPLPSRALAHGIPPRFSLISSSTNPGLADIFSGMGPVAYFNIIY